MICDVMPTEVTARLRDCKTGGGREAKTSCHVNKIGRPITFISFHVLMQVVAISQKHRFH